MTGYTVHTDASKKFVDGWDHIFDAAGGSGGKKKKKKAAKKKAVKKKKR